MTDILDLDKIELRRRVAGLTRRQVCDEAGIAPSTWGRIMSGQHSPVMSTLRKLSDAIGRLEARKAAE